MFWNLNDFFVSFHDSNVSYDSSFFLLYTMTLRYGYVVIIWQLGNCFES